MYKSEKQRQQILKAMRKYTAKTKQKKKEYQAKYYSNPIKQARKEVIIRENHHKQATPDWADRDLMTEFYVERILKNKEGDGVYVYEVDHIVPLRSKLVCGLHNEFNLRVVLKKENRHKANNHKL